MSKEEKLVIFQLNEQEYGLPIEKIQEIIRIVEVTPLPSAGEYIKGIINLRGQIIPVINLHWHLKLHEKEQDKESRIIVIESNVKKMGIIVDRVLEVGHYKRDDVENPDIIGKNIDCISGFLRRNNHILQLLDLNLLDEKIQSCS